MGVRRGVFRSPLELEPFYHEPAPDLDIPDTYAECLTLGVRETVEARLREHWDPAAPLPALPDQPIYDEPVQEQELEWDESAIAKTSDSVV